MYPDGIIANVSCSEESVHGAIITLLSLKGKHPGSVIGLLGGAQRHNGLYFNTARLKVQNLTGIPNTKLCDIAGILSAHFLVFFGFRFEIEYVTAGNNLTTL